MKFVCGVFVSENFPDGFQFMVVVFCNRKQKVDPLQTTIQHTAKYPTMSILPVHNTTPPCVVVESTARYVDILHNPFFFVNNLNFVEEVF